MLTWDALLGRLRAEQKSFWHVRPSGYHADAKLMSTRSVFCIQCRHTREFIYIYIYIYIFIYVYIYLYIYIYTYVYISLYLYKYKHVVIYIQYAYMFKRNNNVHNLKKLLTKYSTQILTSSLKPLKSLQSTSILILVSPPEQMSAWLKTMKKLLVPCYKFSLLYAVILWLKRSYQTSPHRINRLWTNSNVGSSLKLNI